jgi:hypothetical protein
MKAFQFVAAATATRENEARRLLDALIAVPLRVDKSTFLFISLACS